jgi:ABC-type multidrug transport system fused ATPase/permease subunit
MRDNMTSLPEIKDQKYYKMSFDDIDKIRKQINQDGVRILVNENELMLYLNQMNKKHSAILKWSQNLSIIFMVGVVIFIFINWKLSPLFFIGSVVVSLMNRKLARQYIYQECRNDKVFLKFALSVGLVKIMSKL